MPSALRRKAVRHCSRYSDLNAKLATRRVSCFWLYSTQTPQLTNQFP